MPNASTAEVVEGLERHASDGAGTELVPAPLIRVRGVVKQFGGVQALRSVDLDLYAGEIHGLMGPNGAGKSTLIRILSGVTRADSGSITLDGKPLRLSGPEEARHHGLAFIHQELNIVPKFTALQNVMLGFDKPTRAGMIDWSVARRQVEPIVRRLGATFSLDTRAEDLSIADQWLLPIARALIFKCRFIAMDEPTASLSVDETDRLFQIVRELAASDIAVLYVSHRLDEIITLSDRMSVFRNGERVTTVLAAEATKQSLMTAIMGHEVVAEVAVETAAQHEATPAVEVRSLRRRPSVESASFAVYPGEIVGLGGLVGAGRTEVARMIFGADSPEAGEILLDGRKVRLNGPHDAIRRGVGFVPEERRSQALMLTQSVQFNLNVGHWSTLHIGRWTPFVSLSRARRSAAEIARRLTIVTPSVDTPVGSLSGGNQQKVVIGRWFSGAARLLILDEPTRGVDVGARLEIYQAMRDLARQGTALLVISSEQEELITLCDRVVVMVEGRTTGELAGEAITQEAILRLSYSHRDRRVSEE